MIKCNTLFVIALVLIAISGTAAAITIDGERSANEWDDNWALGQDQGTGYDINGPFGDKMVVLQNGLWYDEDPSGDSGTSFSESMATEDTTGLNFSGYDLMGLYARYDTVGDVLYGMTTVYGLPGDLDGDGGIAGLVANGDTSGPVTARPITGVGVGEQFSIALTQGGQSLLIVVSGNDYSVAVLSGSFPGFDESNVLASTSQGPNAVYELSVTGLADHFDMSPGEGFEVKVIAGGNLDIPGEDQASIFIEIPNPDIDIEKATNGDDADAAPGPGIPEGDALIWTYVVTNTGNVPLENVVVTDDKLGIITDLISNGDGDEILVIGETWIYAVEGVAECGQYENDATVVGFFDATQVDDNDPSHYFGECPEIDIEKATNGEDADTAPGPGIPEGDAVTWTYVVTNTGNVDLTNIQVTDNVLGAISNIIDQADGDDTLAVGESWILEATGDAECGPYENEATVTGDSGDTTVDDSDLSHYFGECPEIDIEKATNGEDADTAPGPGIPEGDVVTWTYVVTNTGNVDLTNIQVADNVLGAITNIIDKADGDDILAVGESWTLEATGTAECGPYENEATVTGDSGDTTVDDSDPSHYFGECPEIDIEKATNGEDADTAPGPGIPEGDVVTWTYVVTNTGNVDLTNIQVADNVLGAITNIIDKADGDDILAVGESWTLEATGTAECGPYENEATVTGDSGDTTVDDSDPSHYFGECPEIDIEKATNGEDADTAPGPEIPEGDAVTWTYVVTNTGNVDLTNIQVTDNVLGAITNIIDKADGDDILAIGESWTLEATGDAECGPYENEATVTGDSGDTTVDDSDLSHYFGECPEIDIEKATNGEDADTAPGPGIPEGDVVTWTYVVTNTGNVDLTNIQVTDNVLGAITNIVDQADGDDTLAVGESWTLEATGTAECGPYENEATVTGDSGDTTVDDSDLSHYFGECPGIDIEKATNGEDADAAPGPGIPEGDVVTWTYVVTNTGNVDLTNIQVTDNVLGAITNIVDQADGDDTLAVGESWILEATGDAECGQYENEATVTGDADGTQLLDVDLSHYFGECPGIDIEKATNGEDADAAPGPGIPEGDLVTWTYVVTNTGNVDLTNIQVTDNVLGAITNIVDQADGDDTLAVGESWILEATGDAECGQYENEATVTGDADGTQLLDVDLSHYFGECPGIDIEKATNGEDADTAPGPGIPEGDAVTWTYVVTNTGNVDLTNIQVTDNVLGAITNIVDQGDGDDTLAVGESWILEATGDAECGQYENEATVTGDADGTQLIDVDLSHYFGECPDIDIEKATNGEDADAAPGPTLDNGDAVTWTYVVTNTGNVDLTNIQVTDNVLGAITNIVDQGDGDDILAIGESWTLEATGSASCGDYVNLGTVNGDYNEVTVSDEDPSHYNVVCAPNIDIEKSTNGVDADLAPGPTLAYDSDVTWTYIVRNTGNVQLTDIVVNDDKLGIITNIVDQGNGDDTLVPGEEWVYEATGKAECGQYANIADVVGQYGAIPVVDNDPSHYNVNCGPDIDIEKYINGKDADSQPGVLLAVGDEIIWTFVVENTGNVPLENVVVDDDKLGVIPASSIISKSINNDDILDPGDVWTYELRTTVEECVPQHTNIAVATGEFEGSEVTDDDPANYYCQPVVPVLSPVGMLLLIAVLGLVGTFYTGRRE
ncbi:hypothetical protein V7O66_06060 [Methanolobus sp. ZRKC3]|uniref:DUF7507 domain-containing protein n=1 Tax=Methanolobus sp. ZRKC3 TaxID=3125786 RepID=UPI00324F62E1